MSQNNNILEELKAMGSALADFPRNNVYSVPPGYFDSLAENVLLRIKAGNTSSAKEELEILSPLLSKASKKMPYEIPSGYFDQALPAPQKAKVVAFTKTKWFRIAAAAVIAGMIILASLFYFGQGASERKAEKVFVKLSRDIRKMTETQKDSMIDYMDAGLTGEETVQTATRLAEVKELLMDVSAEELKLFQEQSEDIEEVLMTN